MGKSDHNPFFEWLLSNKMLLATLIGVLAGILIGWQNITWNNFS